MNWDTIKSWGWVAAISAGLAVLITKFFDVLSALLGPEVAVYIVWVIKELVVILLVAMGSIIFSWVVTEVFKRIKWPDQSEWTRQKGRLWLCSITWNFAINGGLIALRYQPIEVSRHALTLLAYNFVWTAVVAGIGIAAYDVFVRRAWHRILRHFFPTKWVMTQDGKKEERPVDEPSTENEKTIVLDRTEPKQE